MGALGLEADLNDWFSWGFPQTFPACLQGTGVQGKYLSSEQVIHDVVGDVRAGQVIPAISLVNVYPQMP